MPLCPREWGEMAALPQIIANIMDRMGKSPGSSDHEVNPKPVMKYNRS